MSDRVSIAKARLWSEEGKRKYAYNDATGKTVTCKPDGNLSIAIGINLEIGLDDDEIAWLFNHRLERADVQLMTFFKWINAIDDARASVMLDLCFNDGIGKLLGFHKMVSAIMSNNWQTAHDELLDSDAARKLPSRYEPLATILLTGVT